MNQSKNSRFLAFVLALVMVISMVPVYAQAAEDTASTATLVTDLSSLSIGDKVVIAAAEYDYALSTNQKNNNRGAAAVTKDGDTVTLTTEVQVLTLEAGTVDGTYAFNTGSGYLYAAGQSKAQGSSSNQNYLRTSSELDANGSWAITITDGVASIVAQGENGCNIMQYNINSALFAAYSAASQAGVSLYKLTGVTEGGEDEPDETTGTVYTKTDAIADGDEVVLFNANSGTLVSSTASGYKLAGVAASDVDGTITTEDTAVVWTVGIDDDGNYTFSQGEMMLGMVQSGSYVNLSTKADDGYTAWTLSAGTADSTYYLRNTKMPEGNYGPYYLEYYSGGYTAYGSNSPSDAAFGFVFYKVEEDEGETSDAVIADGSYVIWEATNSKAATALTGNYGYLQTVDVALTDGALSGYSNSEIFTITNVSDGQFTIQDSNGKYLYMTGTYNSFNVSAETPAAAHLWSAVNNGDGTYTITNVAMGKTLSYDTAYNSFGAYADPSGSQLTSLTLTAATGKDETEEPEDPVIPDDPETPEGTKATLVTDLSSLSLGDEIILVAPEQSVAMSVNNGNYFNPADVTLVDDLVYFGDDVQTLILEAGLTDGTYAFNASGYYPCAVSGSNNYLKQETSITAYSSWTIEIAEDGIATIKSSASDAERNWIRYNATSPRFSCYKSGQKDVAIYKVERPQYAELSTDIADGDQFVIFYIKDSMVMSDVASGSKLTGIETTPTGDFILVEEDMAVLTASVDENGYYTLTNADGLYLTCGSTGNSLTFAEEPSDYSLWLPEETDGGWLIKSVNAAYSGYSQYIEIYSSLFTTFSLKDTSDKSYYTFAFYELTDSHPTTDEKPVAGDQVVLYNLDAKGVLAAENDTQSIENALAEIVDGVAYPENGGVVFTVEQNGNYYRFYNETYGYLCSNGTGNNAFYSLEASEDADWTLSAGKSGGYNLESRTAKYNGTYSQYLEYYADSYKTYSMYNVTNYDIYEFFFYPVAEDVNITGGIVNVPDVVFVSTPAAYLGETYVYTFSVDAVFGVETLTVTASANYADPAISYELTPVLENEVYTVTLTVEQIQEMFDAWTNDGTPVFAISISGVDTTGVAFSNGSAIDIIDEPSIGAVTPAANAETGDDKTPVISAEIYNAGEDATVTMTVNGVEVEAVYANGVVTYTPAEAMDDGRTTVVVTVVRADGKEVSKTWSFTVGEAKFQLYFGQLHSHTTYSDGSGTLESALEYIASLPESANVDFVAFTDHSNYFDASGAANPETALYDLSQATANSQKLWTEYVSAIRNFNASQSDIVAIPGFEMTWSGGPGHMNTFNTEGVVSRNNTTLNNKTNDAGMKAYYALLSQSEGIDSISQFNHPGSTFGTFSDFAYWDAVIDSRIYLVEVGNGEGQIGAGGYYPSYEYYTMALDKGWHVAPTNNQDNHKGKWGNANDARDVILTDNFTEEGIYEAIRAMRMYATEDKNLEITYSVNGQLLGSSITEVPETLEIAVTVYDPDASDSISKVEVIVNSGKVAYTWSDPADLADGALSVTLDPTYSYYYIRVTEGDGDLAVTAPVWVGESLKLGISSVESSTTTPVTDEELTITTTLFNSESSAATIKSMVYTIGDQVVGMVTPTDAVIPASGTTTVEFAYTPVSAKVTTITVTAIVEQDGVEYTFSMDIQLDVQDASKLVYIGIDASHYNEYVNGNYKDSMGNFSSLAAEYSVRTVQLYTSEDLIAACENEKYVALILTAPSRRSSEAQASDPLKIYTEEELNAIDAFNQNGGTVILAGWSDHYENYPDVASIANMQAYEHMAATQNAILEKLGSSLRIGDDATYDDEYNGGQAYRLYFNTYGDSFLTDGVEVDPENPHDRMYTEVFSHYGGASVYTVDGTLASTVNPVVFGHSGTYSVDVDGDGLGGSSMYKYTCAEGDERLMIMATEELSGRGLIVVSGAAFMSNFEVQATIEDSGSEKNYSNYKICENLLQYLNPVTVTDIAEVHAQTEAGVKYTIEGVVTSNASGYDKDTAFFDCIYVQDATGGICCFPVAGNYKIGDLVRITGTTDFYQGEPELQVTSIEVIGEGTVEPTQVTAAQINDRSVEGMLVTISGTVESFELANGLVQTIMVKDAQGNVARIFIDGYITTSSDVENLDVGAKITATGLASYDDTFNAPDGPFPRIRIRNRADVVCTEHEVDVVPMYRMYNPNSGEHFFTGSEEERDDLIANKWDYEGIAFYAPTEGAPVYRVYNPNSGDHHYTMNLEEVEMLESYGWVYEGIGWYSADETGVPQYRLWNRNADCGSHHYTSSEEERDILIGLGWVLEGIGWYSVR